MCAGQQPQKPAEQPQAKQDGPPRWKWWLNPDSRKEFNITDQQSKLVDQVWQQYAPTQRENWQTLEREEAVLRWVFWDGETLRECGARLGVSEVRAQQLKTRVPVSARRLADAWVEREKAR